MATYVFHLQRDRPRDKHQLVVDGDTQEAAEVTARELSEYQGRPIAEAWGPTAWFIATVRERDSTVVRPTK